MVKNMMSDVGALSSSTTLLTEESRAGTEFFARYLHARSDTGCVYALGEKAEVLWYRIR